MTYRCNLNKHVSTKKRKADQKMTNKPKVKKSKSTLTNQQQNDAKQESQNVLPFVQPDIDQ